MNPQRPRMTRQFRFGLFGLTMAAFGLLLWARLILVTGHPRTATADPAVNETARAQGERAEARASAAASNVDPQGSDRR